MSNLKITIGIPDKDAGIKNKSLQIAPRFSTLPHQGGVILNEITVTSINGSGRPEFEYLLHPLQWTPQLGSAPVYDIDYPLADLLFHKSMNNAEFALQLEDGVIPQLKLGIHEITVDLKQHLYVLSNEYRVSHFTSNDEMLFTFVLRFVFDQIQHYIGEEHLFIKADYNAEPPVVRVLG